MQRGKDAWNIAQKSFEKKKIKFSEENETNRSD
jgi:hypothetical protein